MTLPRCRSLLLRVARASTTRQSSQLRQFSALSRIEYGATVSFRHSHSFAETETVAREHPIDIIEGEKAIRTFRQLVQDGEYSESRRILVDFVQNHELGGNLGLFRELRDIITSAENTNMKLLVDLGEHLARRGHFRFVREEIRPLFQGDDILAAFDHVLDGIEGPPSSAHSSGVFEEPSDDYVLSSSTPATPSISDLVQATLPELLPEFTASDTSLFEESSVEYPAASKGSQEDLAQRNARVLDLLIEEKSYDRAFSMLQEMVNAESPIAPSITFGEAAEEALRQGKIDQFLSWLSHVPSHRQGDLTPHFKNIHNLLFRNVTLDLHLLRDVVILLAAKEYRPVVLSCVQALVRNTKSISELEALFLQVEGRVHDYWMVKNPPKAVFRQHRYARFLRRVAVVTCATEGRVRDAVSLLSTDNETDFFLTPRGYETLLNKLKHFKQEHLIPAVRRLQARDLIRIKAHFHEFYQERDYPKHKALHPPSDHDGIHVHANFIAQAIQRNPAALPADTIANFISSYVEEGYPLPGMLHSLAQLAQRSGKSAVSRWTLGEMLFYRRRGDGHLVVKTFVEHFYLDGVPAQQVMDIYNRDEARSDRTGARVPRAMRVTGMDASAVARGKLWHGAAHRALVWEVLIARAAKPRDVWQLYHMMCEMLEEHRAAQLASATSPSPSPSSTTYAPASSAPSTDLLASTAPPLLGPDVFMAFLKALSPGPKPVERVLADMLRLGVRPDLYVLNHSIYIWARTLLHGHVWRLLRAFRAQYPPPAKGGESVNEDVGFDGEPEVVSSSVASIRQLVALGLPEPDVSLYVFAVRGFMEAGHVTAAWRVVQMLGKMLGVEDIWRAQDIRGAPGNEALNHYMEMIEEAKKMGSEKKAKMKRIYEAKRRAAAKVVPAGGYPVSG